MIPEGVLGIAIRADFWHTFNSGKRKHGANGNDSVFSSFRADIYSAGVRQFLLQTAVSHRLAWTIKFTPSP